MLGAVVQVITQRISSKKTINILHYPLDSDLSIATFIIQPLNNQGHVLAETERHFEGQVCLSAMPPFHI